MSRLWSESQEKLFTDLWNQGLDTNVIGTRMAEVGRPLASSSVIDRARRMQLAPRNTLPVVRSGGWTDDEREIVTKLWGEGQSARDIACVISRKRGKRTTRSAVIGIVHRMGLPKRKVPKAPKYTKPKPRASLGREMRINAKPNHCQAEIKLKKKTQPLPRTRKSDKDRIGPTLEQLTRSSCRWPVGVDAHGNQMFCGCEAVHPAGSKAGQPYCEEHLARSKSSMSAEQRKEISDRMKALHRSNKVFNPHERKKAA